MYWPDIFTVCEQSVYTDAAKFQDHSIPNLVKSKMAAIFRFKYVICNTKIFI